MAKPLRPKRGTTAKNDAFTGLASEITIDTDKHSIRVHDGVTAGGHALATDADLATVRSEAQTAQTTANAAQASAIAAQSTADACLPLSGSTMSGQIAFSYSYPISASRDDLGMLFAGGTSWNKGAHLILNGKDNVSRSPGSFEIVAHDGTNESRMEAFPDGSLKWEGKEVERVNSSGKTDASVWVRYESGLQICAVDVNYTANAENAYVSLPVAFTGVAWSSLANYSDVSMAAVWSYLMINSQTIKVSVYHTGNKTDYLTYSATPTLICVGFWK